MFKKGKRITAWLLVFTLLAGITGCAALPKFDAAKFLEASLDYVFKNDTSKAVELGIDTGENLETIHSSMMDQMVESFFTGVPVSNELKQRYRNIFADLLLKANYTVKDSQKLSDNSYAVTVSYSQMKIFGSTLKKIKKNLNKLSTASKEIYIENYFTLVAESMEKILSDELEYGTEEVMVFHIDLEKNKYKLNMEDVMTLVMGLIDYDAASQNS